MLNFHNKIKIQYLTDWHISSKKLSPNEALTDFTLTHIGD